MKDNFSHRSDLYEKYRPIYPAEFYNFIIRLVGARNSAWDCGTGNGQVALELSKHFDSVYASDISASQLEQTPQKSNVIYSLQPAENTSYGDDSFDLIVVAQAVHWFDFDRFYREVRRTAKNKAVICLVGYGRLTISKPIDILIDEFYHNKIGGFWDKERKYIDEEYRTIPFPFEEIYSPAFSIKVNWNLAHLIGYLNTWSAVKHYSNKYEKNPVENLHTEIEKYWTLDAIKSITFPLFCRVGIINKH